MGKPIKISSKITGSADNIFELIESAINKYVDGGEHPGIGLSIQEIVEILNSEEYNNGKHTYYLKASTLQKSIYNRAKKLSKKDGLGYVGLTFVSPYLNRLCKYVFECSFETKYGKFEGILWDLKQGVEKAPTAKTSTNNTSYLNDLHSLGIIGTVNKLSSSRFEPIQSMIATKHSLFFMGILGSKWVVSNAEEFEEFLARVQAKNGKVRFLMINPKGSSFNMLKNIRGEHLKDYSSQIFRNLVDIYPCLEVRFYDFLPCFRLIFIDNKILAMSRYGLTKENYIKSKQGWEAPHLVIEAHNSNWTLFDPFLSYYENIWQQSIDIRELIDLK